MVILLPHFNPCSSSGLAAKLSAQVLGKYKVLLKPLKNSSNSESACRAAFKSTGMFLNSIFFLFAVVCCCPLEVIQLQCMTQGFQIGTTGHPPERHVLLRTEKRDDEMILSDMLLTLAVQIPANTKAACDRGCVEKNVRLNGFISTQNIERVNVNCCRAPTQPAEQDKGGAEVGSVGGRRGGVERVNRLVREHFSPTMKNKEIKLYLLGNGLLFGSVSDHHVHRPPTEPLRDALEAALLAWREQSQRLAPKETHPVVRKFPKFPLLFPTCLGCAVYVLYGER